VKVMEQVSRVLITNNNHFFKSQQESYDPKFTMLWQSFL